MSATTVHEFEKSIRHVWSEPKAMAAMEIPFGWQLEGNDPLDLDWWEPRYDQPWRRRVARDREAFGGEYVAQAKAPLEGPNNPNRLKRELEEAKASLTYADNRFAEATEEVETASARVKTLREKLR